MVQFALELIKKGRNGVILEPRGSAKSTWANTILLSFLAAVRPDIRIGLISNTDRQATAFSRAIRWTFEANERFQSVFGNLVGPKWTDEAWTRKESKTLGTKDFTLFAAGTLGPVISKRFDLILCDDILDEENSATPAAREKVENWFWKTLKPCLVPGGSMVVLGTRWAEGDAYQTLIEDRKWPSLVRSAIKYPKGDVDHEHPSALWPEVWPLSELEKVRADMGTARFACSYMNDISGLMAGNIFRREWYRDRYFDVLPPGHTWDFRMGVDLASSARESADYTAYAVLAENEQHDVYILAVHRKRLETGHRQFIINAYNANPGISRITIENQQFQSALVKELVNTTNLPVVGKRADVDKVTRARALAARYESGKVFHHRSLEGGEFERELLSFPKGHDDQIDAVAYAANVGAHRMFFGSFPR